MSKGKKEQPSEFTMGLVLVETREERRLVAAWPTLTDEVRSECFAGTAAGFALWFRNAGVADLPVHHLSAESLIRSGICRLNGSVQEDVASALSGEGTKNSRARR